MSKIISSSLRKLTAEDPDDLYLLSNDTHKIANLSGVTYDDLVRNFGEPSINVPSADNKVQVEWIFEFEGQYYTLYDWKTYNRDYTLQELTVWSIGGFEPDHWLFEAFENTIDRSILISYNR
jgi:hypothetical protein